MRCSWPADAYWVPSSVRRRPMSVPASRQRSDEVLRQAGADPAHIRAVMIGTTHFTNSFVQAHGLARVGVLRLAAPATTSLPPFVDWPAALLGEVAGPAWVVRGGYNYDGSVIAQPDAAELRSAVGSTQGSRYRQHRDLVGVRASERRAGACGARSGAGANPGRAHHAVERDWPPRSARARERGDHERVPRRHGKSGRRVLRRGARGERHQLPVLRESERRHAA